MTLSTKRGVAVASYIRLRSMADVYGHFRGICCHQRKGTTTTIEILGFSETTVHVYSAIRRHTPEDGYCLMFQWQVFLCLSTNSMGDPLVTIHESARTKWRSCRILCRTRARSTQLVVHYIERYTIYNELRLIFYIDTKLQPLMKSYYQ